MRYIIILVFIAFSFIPSTGQNAGDSLPITDTLTVDEKIKLCSEEIAAILKKYNCDLIVTPQTMYGQTIYVPAVVPMKEK